MLDSAHKLVLRSVAKGDSNDSPARRTLVAAGLVEQRDDGSCAVTPAGRVALEEATTGTDRMERILWPIAAVCLGVLAVDVVIGWVT